MTKASDNAFPSILITEGTEPSAPAAGKQRLYIDSTTHKAMLTNSSGTESEIGAAGSMATDALWDAAGDIAQGTGANTGAKLGAGTAGQFLKSGGAATANAWASRELDYVEKTSATSITATSEATGDTVISSTSLAYDGSTIVMIEFFAPQVSKVSTSTSGLILDLWEDSTAIGRIAIAFDGATTTDWRVPVYAVRRRTPSNASHQYHIKGWTSGGTSVTTAVGGGAGGTGTQMPAFIRITRAV